MKNLNMRHLLFNVPVSDLLKLQCPVTRWNFLTLWLHFKVLKL